MVEELIRLFKKYKLTMSVISALILLLGTFFFLQKKPEEIADFPELSTTTVTEKNLEETTVESPEVIQIVVDVKGAVKNEGLYELDASARVHDAIQAAGGFSEQADKKSVNLAQKLNDEAVVYVASQGENVSVIQAATSNSATESTRGDATKKINLNTATVADLTTISGIGEKRANDILAYRDSNGGFSSVDDLNNVSGIGDKTLENIRPYVTVD